ncbi:NAD(P)-dependent oxidoreductase [Roseovarius nubinhibens]|uniref:NAD(P)-dependent oxidoreductase n=1 Tax=Roseovarius nubinhibens TaxID=314263 RepID=UPI001C095803|nr:NAD(P)-dependent oxidoreductase [Roseovarius nubinhibens]MBU2999756.1 NAD(P)-dependent oxidoreductase [Roseovarius nubinhibens]
MSLPETLGFVGLGQMGEPMAAFIAKGETPLICYDRVPGLAPKGASEVTDLAELVAKSDTIFLSLPDGKIVNAVARDIAACADVAGKVVIDMSTIGPDAAKEANATLTAAGITFIDAPVSGGRQGALKASITVIWSGSKAEMERHQPILDLFSRNSFHVGDTPGQGQAVKLLNNFLSATAMAASSEAVLFGLAHGVEMKVILDVVKVSTGNNTAIEDKFPNRILTGTYDAGFFAELLNKDVRLYSQFAEEAATSNLMGRRVAEIWQEVEDSLPPQSDFTRVFEVLQNRGAS